MQPFQDMIFEIDPLTDPRWPEFLRAHPRASVFHTRGWLEAVRRTYGYKPAVLTTAQPNSDLVDGLVFCRVRSWLTGRRLVSFPFSDHCQPLVESAKDLACLISGLEERAKAEGCKYVELRPKSPLAAIQADFQNSQEFYLHRLDLRAGAGELFRHFHRDCIQRKIRRAEREEIEMEEGRDAEILRKFYTLVLQTRRRHGLPPQPIAWFRNLMKCLRESATIRCVCKHGQPIAAILTVQHGKTLYYKYGASDRRFHNLGAMPHLIWCAIQDAIRCGLEELDMGRSNCDNPGLLTFKEHWGAARSVLSYWRFPADAPQPASDNTWKRRLARSACRSMPDICLTTVGTLLYRHIA
jgi:hypothetical protein